MLSERPVGPGIRFLRDNNLEETVDVLDELFTAIYEMDGAAIRRMKVSLIKYSRETKTRQDPKQMSLLGQLFE